MPPPIKKNEMLEAALAYAALGYKVIPLHTPVIRDGKKTVCTCNKSDCEPPKIGKHPRNMAGSKEATTDIEKIKEWWGKWPYANIGIATGDGLMVVDLDPSHNGIENWNDLVEKNEKLPDTAVAITGSGGRHLLFTTDVPISNSASTLAKGVDTRGTGGYIVVAPSLHYSGNKYEWELSSSLLEGVKPVPIPEWIKKLTATASKKTGATVTGIDGMIPDGKRNESLFSLGRSMRAKGSSEAVILAALMTTNYQQCNPPLDPKEVEILVAQVCKVPSGLSDEAKAKIKVSDGGKGGGKGGGGAGGSAAGAGGGNPADDDFERGDHAELSDALIKNVKADAPCAPVYDRGDLWTFKQSGLWEPVPQDELLQISKSFAGMTANGGKPIRSSWSDGKGIVDYAKSTVSRNNFFNQAPEGLAFRNGFLSIDAKGNISLDPLIPDHRACHMMPFDYDPAAKCSRFLTYLQEVFYWRGEDLLNPDMQIFIEQERKKRIGLLQEFSGACLVGFIKQHSVALVLTGEGANGKSVFITVIRELFPKGSVVSISPQDWSNKFYLAELASARLNAVNEMPDNEIADSAAFKSVISGDSIMVARKNQRPFALEPQAGHLFACNALPPSNDLSEGFWRRFIPIEFNRVFKPNEREIGLADRLIREEMQGIAAWVVHGAAALRARGEFVMPETSEEIHTTWRKDSDQVAQFVEEATLPTDGTERMTSKRAYPAYRAWAKSTGHQPLSQRKFEMRLAKVLPQQRDKDQRFYKRIIKPEFATQDQFARYH